VVLADREHVESELIGELDLLQQLAHALRGLTPEARSAKVAIPSSKDCSTC
jgi:hypothetical protein